MWTTLIALIFCHFIADFTHLSTPWMIQAKALGKPLFPIFVHAGVHATLFFLACTILHNFHFGLIAAAIQWPTHFIIDVWKGRMHGWFPALQNTNNPYHWYLLGFDQMLHHIVLIGTVYYLFN